MLALVTFWEIWKDQNHMIFNNNRGRGNSIDESIEQWVVLDQNQNSSKSKEKKMENGRVLNAKYPVGFFDGVAQEGRCGSV